MSAGDRSFDAHVRFPLTDPAWDGDAPLPGGPWPVVIFGHGYLSPVELYRTVLTDLAAAGYLVIAPTSGGELFPDHGRFAADFSTVIDWLTAETGRADGWLAGAADLEHIAASGHSMGGGAATLATAADPRIATLATLAAAETRPSAVAAAADIRVPSLLIAGEIDAIAPVATHQRPMFEALTSAPAALRIITGGSHCGFIDEGTGGLADALTGFACDTATIPRETQLAITSQVLTEWLEWALRGDPAARERAWSVAEGDGTTLEARQP